MNKEEIEAIELKKQQDCKIVECGVVDNNIKLRLENIKLKKQIEQLENKVKEQEELTQAIKTKCYRQKKFRKRINREPDEFNQGQEFFADEILNLLKGE